MKIHVIYIDGTPGAVSAHEIEGLIQNRKLLSFRRSSGWVRIATDTLREFSKKGTYKGRERRET